MNTVIADTDALSLPKIPVISGTSRGLRVFSKIVAFSVFFLIFMGALVTSNDAGLAVPDWPTSFGENMFLYHPSKWRGIIFYEHVHRLIASGVGALTVVLAAWTWFVEKRPRVRRLTTAALMLVVVQGLLGGLTVLFLLPTAVSSAHAVIGQTFFVLTIIIAYFHSREFEEAADTALEKRSVPVLRLALFSVVVVYLQLIIGAVMRHSEAGLAIPDFPTMGGEWIPRFDSEMLATVNQLRVPLGLRSVDMSQVVIHFAHRVGAFVVVIALVLLGLRVNRQKGSSKLALQTVKPLMLLLLAQFGLGVVTVWSGRMPWMASAHVTLGAGLLAATVLLAMRIRWGFRRT